jgi:hypothetical protein
MFATFPAHLILLDFISVVIFGEGTNFGAPHYTVLSIVL